MSFSTTSWHSARRVWTLEIDGRRWTARPVSLPVVIDYYYAIATAAGAEKWDVAAKLLRHAFPWRLSYQWRRDPVKEFRKLAREFPDAANGLLKDFFPCLAGTPPRSES